MRRDHEATTMKIHTLNDIGVLLHYHAFAEPHPRVDSPAVQESLRKWMLAEMLTTTRESDSGYKTTERAEVWIEHIKSVPLPTRVTSWVISPKESE